MPRFSGDQQIPIYQSGLSMARDSIVKTAIKRENGMDYPPRDYAYVPDPSRPATWKLRLTTTPGEIDEVQLRRAAAALSPKGFRGNRVDIPVEASSSVKRRVRAEFRRLRVGEEVIPLSVKDVAEEDFFIWKDATTDLLRWFAIYSNNFRDDDRPSEIISEQSHLTFVELVDKGIVDYPELWLWHTKGTTWGKADWVAYSNGFAMASGLVYPGYEHIAKNLSERGNLRVSHGMPQELVVYDTKDKSVIAFHVTAEISPLPDWAAANMLTGFAILTEGDAAMTLKQKGLPTKKRAFLKEAGFDDELIDTLDSNLRKAQSAATRSGLQSKESEGGDDIAEDDNDELEVSDTADDEEADEEAEEEVAVVAKAAAKPKAKAVAAKKKEAAPQYATKQEIADAIGAVLQPLMQRVDDLNDKFGVLTKEVTALKADDEKKIAHTKEVTPTASLAELISQSVIGKSKAKVKESTDLAQEGPVETPVTVVPSRTPVPFINQMIANNQQPPPAA